MEPQISGLAFTAMSIVPQEFTSRLSSAHHACVTPNRALYIADVLEMILDELVSEKRSISHLAFTCKALAEPALDRLWALNDSLEPFISLLPKELTLDVCSDCLSSVRPDLTLYMFTGKFVLSI